MLTLSEIERVVAILARRMGGGHAWQIQDVAQPDGERVVLSLYGREPDGESRRRHLLLCCATDSGRISLVERKPRRPEAPPAFAQWLNAHVRDARIGEIVQLGGDRIVSIELLGSERAGRLIFQLFGRRSNVYGLDGEGKLAACLRPLRATRPELQMGEAWRGPDAPPREGEDRFADVGDDALFAAIEAHYSEREESQADAELERRLTRALDKEERRVARKLEKIDEELAAAGRAEELARHGELLKNALGSVPKKASEVVVTDPANGEEVRIELDPSLSAAQNLEGIFKRYKKALRKLTKVGGQQDGLRAAAAELAALREAFEAARDAGAMPDFAEGEAVQALLSRHAPAPQPSGKRRPSQPSAEVQLGKRSVPRRLAPRRYPTEGGLEIWVGRSDAANDFLTMRLARGKDLFFHLDGAPGSHVILRTEGRSDPPSEAVIDACELAVHYSKAKNATRADVHVVPIANVSKPKGAKPGLVMVHGGRTVHLRRTPGRLERLLESKIDD